MFPIFSDYFKQYNKCFFVGRALRAFQTRNRCVLVVKEYEWGVILFRAKSMTLPKK